MLVINKTKIARAISNLLYPSFTAIVATFILFFGLMGFSAMTFLIALIYSLLITLAPYIILRLLIRKGKVSDRDVTLKKERRIFFQLSIIPIAIALIFIYFVGVSRSILVIETGVLFFFLIYYLVSPYLKISVHVGTLTYNIVALVLLVNRSFVWLFPLLIIQAWSRKQLGKHTYGQSLLGAVIGGGIPLMLFRLFIE
jgi:hypothetical protein